MDRGFAEHAFSVSVHFCVLSSGNDDLYVRVIDAVSDARKVSNIRN